MAATTIPSPTSGSDVIQQHLQTIATTGVLGGDVWSYSLATSPWSNILPRGKFATGRGARQRTMHFDRALAGSAGKFTWAAHGSLGNSSAAAGNSPPDVAVGSRSLPPVTTIQARAKVDEFGLNWAACESPLFDVRDAVFNYNFVEQFSQYYEKVKEGAGRAYEYKLREEYFRMCDKKYLLGVPEAGSPTNPYADLSVVAPTSFAGLVNYSLAQLNATNAAPVNGYSSSHSVLTNGVLQDQRPKLERLGALKSNKTGGLIPLICSPEQQHYLIREPGMRTDVRYDDPGALLKTMGANYKTTLLGYNLIPDPEVPRFTLALNVNGSTYDFTEAMPWSYQAGNLRTNITAATAAGTAGSSTRLTVDAGTTVGIVANNVIRIAPTSASDSDYSGEFTVLSVDAANDYVYIDKEFTSTMTGTLSLIGNGESGWVENPSYHIAPYEMSFIVFPQVTEIQTVDYPSSIGSGTNFATQPKPLGSFKWVNEYDRDFNPDRTLGFFRGCFELAAKPMMTEHGIAIMHRRAPAITLATPSFAMNNGLGWLS